MSDLKSLENTVAKERIAFRSEIQALQNENMTLAAKLRQLLESNDRFTVIIMSQEKNDNYISNFFIWILIKGATFQVGHVPQ